MKITYLDGKRLYYAFLSGAKEVIANKKELNKKAIGKNILLGLIFAVWTTSIVFIVISGYFPNAASSIEDFLRLEEFELRSQSSYFLLISSIFLVFYLLLEDIKKRYLV